METLQNPQPQAALPRECPCAGPPGETSRHRINDVPRNRVLKDELPIYIAAHAPKSADELMARAIKRDRVGNDRARELICVLDKVRAKEERRVGTAGGGPDKLTPVHPLNC